jgi:hypothetical protein
MKQIKSIQAHIKLIVRSVTTFFLSVNKKKYDYS